MTAEEAESTRISYSGPPISQDFQLMAKPIGPRCNLRCVYCFYRPKESLYGPSEKWRMSDQVLEAYVRQYLGCLAHKEEVVFAWQGGEPTLMGIEFFKKAVRLQEKYKQPGQKISNSFQTNGVLIDEKWCRFFKEHGFLIGLSTDGPPEVHDPLRIDPEGRPTSARVLRALELMLRYGVEFNVLCCVHRLNENKGREVYRFFRSQGVRFIQFIPIVVPVPGKPGAVSPQSVTPEGWGRFMCDVFDEWVKRDVGSVFVQAFDMSLAAWLGMPPPLCVHAEVCGRALIIEHNGDIYSCDHFVTPDHFLGNLLKQPLRRIVDQEKQIRFGLAKLTERPEFCRQCPYDFVCKGECPKNRLVPPPGEDKPLNYLCAGLKRFFEHIAPTMERMAAALRAGLPASVVMEQKQQSGGPNSGS